MDRSSYLDIANANLVSIIFLGTCFVNIDFLRIFALISY